jgi:hypothetical protein
MRAVVLNCSLKSGDTTSHTQLLSWSPATRTARTT